MDKKRIYAVVTSSVFPLETFVNEHLQYLNGGLFLLCGSLKPVLNNKNEKILIERNFLQKVIKRISIRHYDSDFDLIKNYLLINKISAVLVEYGTTAASLLPLFKSMKMPIVVHFHGFDAFEKKILDYHKESYLNLFNYASSIIAVSKDMKLQLENLGCSNNKIHVIPCSPNLSFLKLQCDYNSNNVLMVGRMVDKKAPYLALEAFKLVAQHNAKIHLNVVGDGPLLETCINLCKVWKIEDRVTFYGKVNDLKDLQNLFVDSFCFIQHSIVACNGDAEGTPVSILEASAAGLPIVATKHMGIKDSVVDGETGFLVDEFDVFQMSEKIQYFYDDRKLAKIFGIKGKFFVKGNNNPNASLSQIEKLLDESLINSL